MCSRYCVNNRVIERRVYLFIEGLGEFAFLSGFIWNIESLFFSKWNSYYGLEVCV